MEPETREFFIVFWAWIIVGIAGGIFFFFSRNADLKRRLWPPYIIGGAILFLFLVWWFLPIEALYAAVPLVALITFINLRTMKFCDACGATTQNLPFRPARFCAKCGAPLQQ